MQKMGFYVDFSHKIYDLSFGNQEDLKKIKKEFPGEGILNPLNGKRVRVEYLDEEDEDDELDDEKIANWSEDKDDEDEDDEEEEEKEPAPMPMSANYYLIAVPSVFRTIWGTTYSVYQLTAN